MTVFDKDRSILRVEWANEVIGTAFVVELRKSGALGNEPTVFVAVTCAHVVLEAAKRAGKTRGDALRLTLCTFLDGEPTLKVAVDWTNVYDEHDVAILHLPLDARNQAIVTELSPLLLAVDDQFRDHEFDTFGFRGSIEDEPEIKDGAWDQGTLLGFSGSKKKRRVQLRDCDIMTEGFSGAPVYDKKTARIVGIVSHVTIADRYNRGGRTAYAIPAGLIREVCPDLVMARECPYQGLEYFTKARRKYWVDGTDLVDKVLARLEGGANLVAISGPSGVGKSSLLHAGVLPALETLAKQWDADVCVMRLDRIEVVAMAEECLKEEKESGIAPSVTLLRLLRARVGAPANQAAPVLDGPGSRGLVAVLDQFEEWFILKRDEHTRVLVNALVELIEANLPRRASFRVIIAYRNHYSELLEKRAQSFTSMLERNSLPIPLAISRTVLRRMIRHPAQLAGYPWNDPPFELAVEVAMLQGHATENGKEIKATALPALQVFLERQWQRHERRQPPPQDVGEVTEEINDALAQLIENVLRAESDSNQRWWNRRDKLETLMIRLLIEFVTFGVGFDAKTPKGRARRQSDLEMVLAQDDPNTLEDVRHLMRVLEDKRILAFRRDTGSNETIVEPMHDRILTGWEPLEKPIEDQRAYKTWENRVWDAAGKLEDISKKHDGARGIRLWLRASNTLLVAGELETAKYWKNVHPHDMDSRIKLLVRESEQNQRWVARMTVVAICGVLLLMSISLYQAREAKQKEEDNKASQAELQKQADDEKQLQVLQSERNQARNVVNALGLEPMALGKAILGAKDFDEKTPSKERMDMTSALLRSILAFELHAPFDGITPSTTPDVALTEDGRRAVFRTYDFDNKKELYALFDTRTGVRLRPLGERSAEVLEPFGDANKWTALEAEVQLFVNVLGFTGVLVDVALVDSRSKTLWLSRAPDLGVQRWDLDKGNVVGGDLLRDKVVTDIHRSKGGSTITLGTFDGSIFIWNVAKDAVTREILSPQSNGGPILKAAASDNGERVIAARVHGSCYYPSKNATCESLNKKGEKWHVPSVDISADGRMAIVAGAEWTDSWTPTHPALVFIDEGNVARMKNPVVLWNLELQKFDTRSHFRQVRFNAMTRDAESVQDARAIDTTLNINPSDVSIQADDTRTYSVHASTIGDHRPAKDGTWHYRLHATPGSCPRGTFRPMARCAHQTALKFADLWLRVASSPNQTTRKVLGFDPQTNDVLFDDWEQDSEVTEPQVQGIELAHIEGIDTLVSRGRLRGCSMDGTSPRSSDFPRTLLVRCGDDGPMRVATIAPFDNRPPVVDNRLFHLRETLRASNANDTDTVELHVSDERMAILTKNGRVEIIDLGTGAEVWHTNGHRSSTILDYDAKSDLLVTHTDDNQIAIFQNGNLVTFAPFATAAEIIPTHIPLIQVTGQSSSQFITVSGDPVPPPAVTPQERFANVQPSPDGHWVAILRNKDAPAVSRILGDPPRFKETMVLKGAPISAFGYDHDSCKRTGNQYFQWLPSKNNVPALIFMGQGKISLWKNKSSNWISTQLTDERPEYCTRRIALSPSGTIAAVERWTRQYDDTQIEYLASAPAHLVELRKTDDWSLIGVIRMDPVHKASIGPVFVDEDHLFLPDKPRIVSLRPDDLRHQACDLLTGRSEYTEEIKNACSPKREMTP